MKCCGSCTCGEALVELEKETHFDLRIGFGDGSSTEREKGKDRGKILSLSLRLAEMKTNNMRRDH